MNPTDVTTQTKQKLLKPADVADWLNISRSLAYRLLQTGEIPAVRFGRSVRVRQSDLETFIHARWTEK